MKRTIIFAHYDRDNVVDPYVVRYLEALRPICNELIFVSDSNLSQSELAKVCADKIIVGKHGEYDFGSYKRGFQAMSKDADQLVFCNDSCYLIDDIEALFEFENDSDFFGVITNTNNYPAHLQSYFVVFNRKVIESFAFKQFIYSITKLEKKLDIIEKYEIGMTQILLSAGFSFSSFIRETFRSNPTMSEEYFLKLRPSGFPFLKTDLLKTNPLKIQNVCRWRDGLSTKQIIMINNHVSRMIGDDRAHWYITPIEAFLKRKNFLNYFFSWRKKNGILRVRVLGIPILRIKFK